MSDKSNLPKLRLIPLIAGNQTKLGNDVAVIPMSDGLPRRRRTSVGASHVVNASFTLQADWHNYLMAFYRVYRDKRFLCRLHGLNSQLMWHECQFAKPPKVDNHGGGVFATSVILDVGVAVVVEPPPPPSWTATGSVAATGTFTKSCPTGYTGSSVEFSKTYTATATSTISQADADILAQQQAESLKNAKFNNDGQAYADSVGVCTAIDPSLLYDSAIDYYGYWHKQGKQYRIDPTIDLSNQFNTPIESYYLSNNTYEIINTLISRAALYGGTLPDNSTVIMSDGTKVVTTIKESWNGITLEFTDGMASSFSVKNWGEVFSSEVTDIAHNRAAIVKTPLIVGGMTLTEYLNEFYIPALQTYYNNLFRDFSNNPDFVLDINKLNRVYFNIENHGFDQNPFDILPIQNKTIIKATYNYGYIYTVTAYDPSGKLIKDDDYIAYQGQDYLSVEYEVNYKAVKQKYTGDVIYPYSYYDFPNKQMTVQFNPAN